MPASVYVDTAYHIGIADPEDSFHALSLELAERLRLDHVSFVTSEAALIELLTFLSGSGSNIRRVAVQYVRELRTDKTVEIVPQSDALFERALDLYERRSDKSYSMVDAIGMVICADRGITNVLTADHDFEQEGLTILLK